MSRQALRPLLVVLLLTASACGSCGGATSEGVTPESDPGEARWGVVEGVVRLADGAELPLRPPAADADSRPPMPEGCTPPRTLDRQPVRLGDGRGLGNVLVAAAEFEGDAPPHEPVVHELAIRDCRLEPPFVAATRGDRVEVTNETDHPFLPRQGSGSFMEMLQSGQTRTFDLEQGGVTTIDCGFGVDCGTVDIVVLYHPVHTTTGDAGAFRLDDVPPDEALEVHAWHPLFEEASTEVTVAAGETVRVELVLTPAPPRPAAEPEPEDEEAGAEGPAEEQPGLF